MLLTTTAMGARSNKERPSQAMALGYIGVPSLHGVQALGVGLGDGQVMNGRDLRAVSDRGRSAGARYGLCFTLGRRGSRSLGSFGRARCEHRLGARIQSGPDTFGYCHLIDPQRSAGIAVA